MRRIFLSRGLLDFEKDVSVKFLTEVVVAFLEVVPCRKLHFNGGGPRGLKIRNSYTYVMRLLDFDMWDLDEAFGKLWEGEVNVLELQKVWKKKG